MYLVYKHTDPDGLSYIGMTSCSIQSRMNNGYSHNARFKEAIRRYGWPSFTHEILAVTSDYEEAQKLEVKCIQQFKTTDPKHGYNISYGGKETFLGLHHTDETKEKIRSANTGRVFTDSHRKNISKSLTGNLKICGRNNPMYGKPKSAETIQKQYDSHRGQMRPIVQYSLSGEEIASYESIHAAARELGIGRQSIQACLCGRSKSCRNSIWKYERR